MAFGDSALTIEELHREHGDRIRGYLVRLVGRADAEDLEQDVYERAQRAIGTFRGDSRVLTWLYRVATNVAIDRLRSAERRAELERDDAGADPLGGLATAHATSERSLDGEVDRKRMRDCISRSRSWAGDGTSHPVATFVSRTGKPRAQSPDASASRATT